MPKHASTSRSWSWNVSLIAHWLLHLCIAGWDDWLIFIQGSHVISCLNLVLTSRKGAVQVSSEGGDNLSLQTQAQRWRPHSTIFNAVVLKLLLRNPQMVHILLYSHVLHAGSDQKDNYLEVPWIFFPKVLLCAAKNVVAVTVPLRLICVNELHSDWRLCIVSTSVLTEILLITCKRIELKCCRL